MTTDNPDITESVPEPTQDLAAAGTEQADQAYLENQVVQDTPDAPAEPADETPAETPEGTPAPIAEASAPGAPAASPAAPPMSEADQIRSQYDALYRQAVPMMVDQASRLAEQKYVSQGYTDDQARTQVAQERDITMQQIAAREQLLTVHQQGQAALQQKDQQVRAAMEVAEKYPGSGVTARELYNRGSKQNMDDFANMRAEIAQLKAKDTKRDHAAVPTQDMADSTPAPAAVSTHENNFTRYLAGARDDAAATAGRTNAGG
jgi:hypothetical protein